MPNSDDILGVSVKNITLIDQYNKNFQEKIDLFKVQDLTLSNLNNMINLSSVDDIIPSISQITEEIYYLIINEQYFASIGSRNKKTGTYSKQKKDEKISNFLDSYFLSLAAVWFGDALTESLEKDTNIYLMNNGLVYDPNRKIIVPVYKMLEAIQKQISNFSNNMNSIKVNYYFNTSIDPDEFYKEKIEAAPKKGSKMKSYPDSLMNVGIKKGNQVKSNMKVSITLLFLDKLIQQIKI